MKIAFDVDDTLIIPAIALTDEPHPYIGMYGAVPNYDTIALYKWFQAQGNHMIVWSGGGIDYARTWAEKLGLNPDEIIEKKKTYKPNVGEYASDSPDVDIAFDDCEVDLGKVNVRVKRINNGISRAEWNKKEHNAN